MGYPWKAGDDLTAADLNAAFLNAGVVQSVAGRTGAVTLTHGDLTDWAATLAAYAPLASPALTGSPTAPTPAGTDNSTLLATTAYVRGQNYITSAGAPVQSVAGRTGVVALTHSDLTDWTTALASPPAIGGTAAAGGSFTTLSASSTISGAGFTAWAASPPAIGGTAANSGAFTTISASSTVSGAGFTSLLSPYAPLASPTFSGTVNLGSGTVSGAALSTYLASPPAIGGTTPAAGAYTTLSASSTVSGTGFSTYFASPPAIGGTVAAAGAFTTLSASSTVSGSGFSTYLASPAAIGGTAAAAGKFTTLQATSAITPSSTSGIVGTTTNDNANAGSVGEVISSNIASASSVTLTSGTAANVTSISVTAGDWDITGEVWITVGTGGATNLQAGINTTTAAMPTDSSLSTARRILVASFTASSSNILSLRACRASLSGTTTYFLVALASFPSGTTVAFGNIIARRRR